MEDDYLASSSAHSYKIIKPSKRRSTAPKMLDNGLDFCGSYHLYIEHLNNIYSKYEKDLYDDLLKQLESFVSKAASIYKTAKTSSFRFTQCAIVSMSLNFNNSSTFSDLLDEKIEKMTSLRLYISSDEFKSISDFVKLLQDSILNYLCKDVQKTDDFLHNFYSYTASHFQDKIGGKLPVAVIFKDFDCISQTLLNDLLMLIHENLMKMPIILICCQTSDSASLNMRLPSKATNNLSVEHFSCQETRDFFYNLLEDFCLDSETSFKLGPKVLRHLFDIQRLWDTSPSGALLRVKLCVFEHFYQKKYAKLCCPPSEIESIVSNLSNDELNSIRKLDSLKRTSFPKDIKLAKSHLIKEMTNFLDHLEYSQKELKFYHKLKKLLLPDRKFTFIENTWIPFLELEHLSEGEDYQQICERFCELDSDAITSTMKKLFLHQGSIGCAISSSLQKHFKDFESKIQEVQQETQTDEIKPVNSQTQQRITRGQLMGYIVDRNKQPKAVRKIAKWRDDFLELLREEIDGISNPLHMPYHEIFFFDDLVKFKQLSMPKVRQDTLNALQSPEKVLKCECCQSLNHKSPDLSIVYSIYCDLYRVENLTKCYDIFKEFVNKPETRVSPRKRPKKDVAKCDDKVILSRFISAIGDLEYLGLIRAHPRKVDHIERLVWPLNEHSKKDQDSDEQISVVLKNMSLKH